MTNTIPPSTNQLSRQPSAPCAAFTAGTNRPVNIMANPLPMTMKPAARPRRRRANQCETKLMTGTLLAPLANPVNRYMTST
ncbi:MAG: hypothetical protein MAG794_01323 [Gammaproteobacteria bacterium]|nr:hypothetical protein [Gammaproteobacteria bacterium]